MAKAGKPITPASLAKQQAELRLPPEVLERFRLPLEVLERFRPSPPTETHYTRIDDANKSVKPAEIAEIVQEALGGEQAKAAEIAKAEATAKAEAEAVCEAEVLAEVVRGGGGGNSDSSGSGQSSSSL